MGEKSKKKSKLNNPHFQMRETIRIGECIELPPFSNGGK
jgi:hypothetical protein